MYCVLVPIVLCNDRYLRRSKSNISMREFEKDIDSLIDIKELKLLSITQGSSQI